MLIKTNSAKWPVKTTNGRIVNPSYDAVCRLRSMKVIIKYVAFKATICQENDAILCVKSRIICLDKRPKGGMEK